MPYKCTACDKSFRYKVSQRTHKCLSQPPGTVVRQTGDLLQRLIQSSLLSTASDEGDDDAQTLNNNDTEIEKDHNLQLSTSIEDTEFLTHQSLDEFVAESCTKMGIGQPQMPPSLSENDDYHCNDIDVDQHISEKHSVASPSDKFQNMCLYSPTADSTNVYAPSDALNTINESTFKALLYGDDVIL